jgi:hypothetical protein
MTLAEAIAAGDVAAGLSVIPVRADGSKAPALRKGEVEQYRERYATPAELAEWFAPHRAVGVALVGGKISGNLAVLDFESDDVWHRWHGRAETLGVLDFFAGSPVVKTPKGGRHLYCRVAGQAMAGGPLARRAEREMLIEVRGQGHYVLAPGCPVACHELNRPYAFESMGWLSDA